MSDGLLGYIVPTIFKLMEFLVGFADLWNINLNNVLIKLVLNMNKNKKYLQNLVKWIGRLNCEAQNLFGLMLLFYIYFLFFNLCLWLASKHNTTYLYSSFIMRVISNRLGIKKLLFFEEDLAYPVMTN